MLIPRPQDVMTGADDLELLYQFKEFPVFMGCVDQAYEQDVFADMAFYVSRLSGMIQMNPLLPLEVVYPAAHGSGRIGASWDAHHRALAQFIAASSPARVLEIGGGHGILSMRFHELQDASWTILEPNPTPIEGCKAQLIKGFFDSQFKLEEEVDAVVHSHVFEHIYAPMAFLEDLKRFLRPGKRLIFSVPHMRMMLENKYTNCLNFEHTLYLSDEYIDWMLARSGFRIQDKEYFGADHSVFYSAVRDDSVTALPLDADWYSRNRGLYINYIEHHRCLVDSINARIAEVASKEIFLFGAHVQSQYLMAFGLDTTRVRFVLDNDESKTGKRLYGTHLFVQSPQALASCNAPLVIIRAGTFTSEIKEQLRRINPKTEFLS